jgi:hypothetical protein
MGGGKGGSGGGEKVAGETLIFLFGSWDKRVKEKVANEDQEFPGILR